MVTTIFAMILTIVLYAHPLVNTSFLQPTWLAGIFSCVGGLVFLVLGIVISSSWSAIQRAAYKISPHIFELYKKDFALIFSIIWLSCFSLINFVLAFDLLAFHILQLKWILLIWPLLFGFSLDIFLYLLNQISSYLSPFLVVHKLTKAANKSIRTDKEGDLCEWIDSLTELLLRALERSSFSLCISVNNEIGTIMRHFFISSKGIRHLDSKDSQSKALGNSDKLSYTLYFLLQRLEMIFERAVEKHLEPLCTNLITVMGRIAIAAADCDWSLVSAPIHFIGRCTQLALNRKISEVGPKATFVLLEVGKSILEKNDVVYSALREPFQSIIQHMEAIAKEMFRQNKKTNLSVLTQPFRDLKVILKSERVAANPDVPAVLINIERVIGEFDALDLVLRTLPPIPEVPKDLLAREDEPSA